MVLIYFPPPNNFLVNVKMVGL